MSPAEINGLQHLAIAHGGSLTINPTTGLPEAGFLKDFLPSIVGGLAILAAPFTGGMSLLGAAALGGGLAFGTSMAVGNSFKKSLFTGLLTGAGGAATAGLGGLGAGAAGVAGRGAIQTGVGTALKAAPQIAAAELGGVGSTALTQGALRGAGVGAAESLGSTLSAAAPRVFSLEAQQLAQQGAQRGLTQGVQRGLTQEAGVLAQPGRIFAGAAPRSGVTTNTGTFLQTQTPQQAAAQEAAMLRDYGTTRLPQAARPTPYTSYTAKPIEPLPANYGPSSYGGTQAPAPISDISSVASGADKYANMSMGDRLVAQGKGVEKLFTKEGAAEQFVIDNKGSLALAGIGAIGSRLSDPQPGLRAPPPEVSTYAGPYKPVERTSQFQIGPQAYTDTSEFQYFNDVNPYPGVVPYKAAAGGLMGLAGGGSYDDEAGQDGYADGGEVGTRMATPDMDAIQNYVQSISRPQEQQMAMGGMTSLARGGSYLDGPGDGLSDSIPATIGNRQPARLADGEFVISADVVSDIGGGSSKAGAKKLHAMMDRVRQSAHGTKKQVKKLDDRKVLAA
jgi:hypothetical protein